MRTFTITACLALLSPLLFRPSLIPKPSGADGKFIDSVLVADVGGNGHLLQIQFYHRGPLSRRKTHAPGRRDQYVRGIEVATGDGVELQQWEAPPTPRPCIGRANACFTSLDGVWPVKPRGSVITTVVWYGARSLHLWAFRWTGGRLVQVGNWRGRNFLLRQVLGKLVVGIEPPDYRRLPELYVWNGHNFADASHQMPQYYSHLGHYYVTALSETVGQPADFVRECGLALQAYKIAGPIELARNACYKAKRRIQSGDGVIPSRRNTSPQLFKSEKLTAIAQIDRMLKQYSQSSN